MLLVVAVLIGILYTAGVYLMLRRSVIQLIFGLLFLSHAANLLIFTIGGLVRGGPPLAAIGAMAPPPGAADPVPQALVLTAIVIGFALTAFTAALIWRVCAAAGTDDSDALRSTDA